MIRRTEGYIKPNLIRGAIFDFDGTLVQSNHIKRDAFYTVTTHIHGAALALDNLFRSSPHLDRVGIFEELVHQLKVGDSKSLLDRYSELVKQEIEIAPEVPGARWLLTQLLNIGVPMAICSATPEAFIEVVVKARGIERFFSHVFGGVAAKSIGARRAIEAWGISPADVWFFGDMDADRQAAQNLGCRFVGIVNDWTDFLVFPDIAGEDFYCLSKIRD